MDAQLIEYGNPRYPYYRDYGPRWMNDNGDHVGCHPGTTNPLGNPANAEIRKARMDAHSAFDALWKTKLMTRSKAYKLLSGHFGRETHIGQASYERCQEIINWASAKLKEYNA